MIPYKSHLATTVPESSEARLEIMRAIRALSMQHEDEKIRRRHAEIAAIRRDLDEIAGSFCEAWHEWESQVRSEIRSALQKYNPDEPRVPKGNPDGGQWTRDGVQIAQAESGIRFGLPRRRGHHWVPKALYNDPKLNLQRETRKVFENSTSGPLFDKRVNDWSAEHAAYNDAVKDLFIAFLEKNKIASDQLMPAQADDFVQGVLGSSDPRIYKLKMKVMYEATRYWLIRGPFGEDEE
jgi:hypothetical protein